MRQTIALLLLSCGSITLSIAGCAGGESKKSAKPSMIPSPASEPSDAGSSRSPLASESSGRLTINDPCPKRLHDLCGPLLLYYAINQRLPESIDELQRVPGFESVGPNTCPVSKEPYVYNPKGIRSANISQFAVIYDAAPTHSGYRWAIVVEEPKGNAALQAKVVAWAESRFPKTSAPTTAPSAE